MQQIHIETITQLLQFAGKEDQQHPLFYITTVESINHLPMNFPLDYSFGFYTIGLLRNVKGHVACGRRSYDFQKGTMFFLAPNQSVGHALEVLEDADGWLLFFHRAYLANHSLQEKILEYGFFDYAVNEALHLSKKEEKSIEQIFENIHQEHEAKIDTYSKSVVVSNLELILTYANRYYGRQFITRNDVENNFITEFEQLLNDYFKHENLEENGIPSPSYFAEKLNMTAKYLGDKLRVLTGKTAQEHIHLKIIERAKVLLHQKELSISEVAYQLGFEYPQYFSRFFKKRVGMSPKAYQAIA